MLPYLEYLSDSLSHSSRELMEHCATALNLTEEDRGEMTRSGNAVKYKDRTTWAGTYLRKAGCVVSPKRGFYSITQRGVDLLATRPEEITVETLRQYEEFLVFIGLKESPACHVACGESSAVDTIQKTPTDIMADAYGEISESLAEELLDEVKKQSPDFFERLVVKLLVAMGYGGHFEHSARVTKRSHDEGIDGIIKEDKLGLDNVYIQAKRYDKGSVGRGEIQSFVGALSGQRATKGVFITTSDFTREAREFTPALDMRVALIDGKQLCELMIEHNIGVSTREVYEIKKIDSDFFIDE